MIEQSRLTIVGDHQHGKTELLLGYAVDDAYSGKFVLYQCGSWIEVREAFHRAEKIAATCPSPVLINRANGKEEIRFDSGGRIRFARWVNEFGAADTHILDNVDDIPIAEASRVLRSALR